MLITNYLKSTFRSFSKNKFYTFINILGLSIGFICAIFIYFFIKDEVSYDKYHSRYERIYRLESDFTIADKNDKFAATAVPLAPTLKVEYPEIEQSVRFSQIGNSLVKYRDKQFYEENIYYTDSSIFDVFTVPLLFGSPEEALTDPNCVIISRRTALKYFNRENPLNEVITIGNQGDFKITGVFRDLPSNTHLKYDALISGQTLVSRFGEENINSTASGAFWNISVFSYVLLAENASIDKVIAKFPEFYEKYMAELGNQIRGSFNLMATPLADQHFYSNVQYDLPTGEIAYIYIFGAIAIFILLIACINYMNMATARSEKRAREVGIRKVVGAYKQQLIRQFLSESVILAFIALAVAVIGVYAFRGIFVDISGKEMNINLLEHAIILPVLLLVTFVVGLLSGTYPAFFLSSFSPIKVIRGKVNINGKGGSLRKGLVVLQFVISIFMIIGTIIVFNQVDYLNSKDLGYDKEDMVVLQIQDTAFIRNLNVFKEELLQNPNILSATTSVSVPGNNMPITVMRVEREEEMVEHTLNWILVDYDFIDTYQLNLIDGRQFNKEMATDLTEAFIINEAAAKSLHWTDAPLGKKLQWQINLDGTAGMNGKVIGVIEDFHMGSLHNPVEPVILILRDDPSRFMSLKIAKDNQAASIDFIKEKWLEFDHQNPFDYYMLDEQLEQLYEGEQKIGLIFTIFSGICVFIALLGLFGLSSFIASQRKKEIGIRKVLGASTESILSKFYMEFSILIGISFIISIPLAYYASLEWLSNFAYHFPLGMGPFILAGIISIALSLITISLHIVRAARSNPVNSIKYE